MGLIFFLDIHKKKVILVLYDFFSRILKKIKEKKKKKA
jgi:hypothetical protein